MNNPSKRALSDTRQDAMAAPQRDSGYIDYEEGEGEYYEDESVEEDAPEALADVQDYDDEAELEDAEADEYEEDAQPRPSNMPIIAASLLGAVVVLSLILFLVLRGTNSNNGQTGGGTANNSTTEMPRNGYLAPDFTLSRADGSGTVQLASFRGQKPVWLNFWATWCQPCRIEMPEMEQIYSTYKDKIEILGVDVAEDQTLVKSFLEQYNYSWTFALDPDNMAYRKYFSTGIPTHAFIRRDGVISSFIIGGLTRDMMDAELAKLLQ